MGCDIHTIVEQNINGKWEHINIKPSIFDYRNYGLFGFLADVRNYSKIPNPFPADGWPSNISQEARELYDKLNDDGHTQHYITLQKLITFNYDQTFENRRCSVTIGNHTNGAALAEEGKGKLVTFKEFLGDLYFKDLDRLSKIGNPSDVRIIMIFDN